MPSLDLDSLNQREFRKLVLAIKANRQQLGLFLAICDDRNLQAALIKGYETELNAIGIAPVQTRLDVKQPSLKTALTRLVAQNVVQTDAMVTDVVVTDVVVTVLNANELLGVRLTDDISEQERFFLSLQWTREALRQFPFPIVIWLTDRMATRLSQAAPDFWGWRSGVFEFIAPAPTGMAQSSTVPTFQINAAPTLEEPNAVDDLHQLITTLEQTSPESPLLITLYNTLGETYEGQYAYKQALGYYEKALALAEAKGDQDGQARSL
ncbi:MAG: tetratricopeptide repeat protein, partial [Symploca sp. SIO3C6]|nr:tetratricopeptide repeat protein [Symploca sp. SIO3C6]